MAHYASDCWDAEILSSYGWVECVGHADRSCYDLESHSKESKTPLVAQVIHDPPLVTEVTVCKINKPKFGPTFKKDQGKVAEHLEGLNKAAAMALQNELEQKDSTEISLCTGEKFTITKDLVSFEFVQKQITNEKYVPAVIEPSFGIGRILYSLLEHSYYVRPSDEQRRVLSLNPLVAPVKASVLPLQSKPEFREYVTRICRDLVDRNISVNPDTSSAAIGKRYSRADEMGIPFGITIDPRTFDDKTVSLRERDSLDQIRVSLDELGPLVENLCRSKMSWAQACEKYPKFSSTDN